MYLKALEIQGFKSFPDKTVLTFDRDITAIVGPNGSGKSNISDAVRWVLGEQSSKQLRGSRMEDVIFGGTAKRTQSGYAEVTLVLDNGDHRLEPDTPEVAVTRRYYRSGEGEYFINRQAARLKDINELFMDTGLGREGYSNVSQGRIDEILSLKSTDRREIFEEAAGISKYRYRKQEAEHRLSDTQENLQRVEDKLSELALQVEPLRQQAEAAKRYLALRDELRILEISTWMQDMRQLGEQAGKIEADYAAAKAQLDTENAALEQLYAQTQALSDALRDRDARLLQLREQQQTLQQSRSENEQARAVLHTSRENNLQNIRRLQAQMDEQAGREGSIGEQIQAKKDRLTELSEQEACERAEQTQLREQTDALIRQISALNEEILRLESEIRESEQLRSRLQAALSSCTGSEQALMDRETAVMQERATLLQRCEQAKQERDQAQERQTEAAEELTRRENRLNGFSLRLSARQTELDEKTELLNRTGVAFDTTKAKREMLLEMQREYEGYGKAVRLILQERDRGTLDGIHGSVPQLLKTRDEYAVAVETALGGSMQSIVVQSEEAGKKAIQLLKARGGGRATFLPMDVIHGRLLTQKGLDGCSGYRGLASDLIEYAPEYAGIMQNLLGRTVVVDTLDNAVKMANRFSHAFRIVTMDGQILNAGGSMTGGSASASSGVLSRANELERLTRRLEELATRREQETKAVQQARKELDEARRAQGAQQESVTEAREALSACKEQLSARELLLQTVSQSIQALQQELDSLGGKLTSGRDQADVLQDRLKEQSSSCEALQNKAKSRQETRDCLEAEYSALGEQLTRLRISETARQAERRSTQAGLTELENLQSAMAGDKTRSRDLINRYDSQNKDLDERMQELDEQARLLTRQAEQNCEEEQTLQAERAQTEMRKTAAERQQQEANRGILLIERECGRLEQRKISAQLEEKQLADKLWDNYELTPTAAAEYARPVGTEDSRRMGELRRRISDLGTPNLGAIPEFERVNERYTYLTTQREDILGAKAELEGLLDRITTEMADIFGRAFEQIRTAFSETFTELFGGGKANLLLEDSEDILGCGIEIQVQPPGKQLKTITLLSGGEKAFVAIALYFAILRVRPTPFCILDEIDAALDDRNVARYAAYMRHFTDSTQFIVITHRRGTMEASDVLYGVTMTEQGISRMLTLDLDRVEQELHMQAT